VWQAGLLNLSQRARHQICNPAKGKHLAGIDLGHEVLNSGTELLEGFWRVDRTFLSDDFRKNLQSVFFLIEHLPSRLVP
jgi:hypothetical protein